jgi:hypothetical protein
MDKDIKFCQSCGMPLTDDVLGTNADGSKNFDSASIAIRTVSSYRKVRWTR